MHDDLLDIAERPAQLEDGKLQITSLNPEDRLFMATQLIARMLAGGLSA